MQKKTIKCTRCGHSWVVTNPDGLEKVVVTCPVPSCGHRMRIPFLSKDTVIKKVTEPDKGNGYIMFNDRPYPLQHEGLNIVGRASDSSDADIQLETNQKYMSRQHFGIELYRLKSGRAKFVISDLRDKQKISIVPTLVNGEILDKVDKIVLVHGSTIKIGKVKMTFNIK